MYSFSLVIIKDQKQVNWSLRTRSQKKYTIVGSIWKPLFIKLEVGRNYIRDEYECWNEAEEKRNENKGNKMYPETQQGLRETETDEECH